MAKNEDIVEAPVVEEIVEIAERPICKGCSLKDGYCQNCGKFEPVIDA